MSVALFPINLKQTAAQQRAVLAMTTPHVGYPVFRVTMTIVHNQRSNLHHQLPMSFIAPGLDERSNCQFPTELKCPGYSSTNSCLEHQSGHRISVLGSLE